MALLLLDLGTVRQEGPEVTGLLLLLSLRQRRKYVIELMRMILSVYVVNLSVIVYCSIKTYGTSLDRYL